MKSESRNEPSTVLFAGVLLALTVAAGLVRFYRLGEPSLWADELFTIRDAIAGLKLGYVETRLGMLAIGLDVGTWTPEGYSTWRALGLTEWSPRLGAATIGTVTIPVLTLASASFLGRRAALIFALFLTVNTWHIEWSQNARFYAPMFLYYNGALALYMSHRVRPATWKLVVAMIAAALAAGVKPTSLMLFGVLGTDVLYDLVRRRRFSLRPAEFAIAAGGLALAICAILWTSANTFEPTDPLRPFLERPPTISTVRLLVTNSLNAGLALCVLGGIGFLITFRSRETVAVYLGAATLVPLAAFGILGLHLHVETRYTFMNLYGWVALASLASAAVYDRLHRSDAALLGSVPILLVLITTLYADAVYSVSAYGNRPRWRHAFEYVDRMRSTDEPVYTRARWVGAYYLHDPNVIPDSIGFKGLDSLRGPAWLVVRSTGYELGEGRPHWLDGVAELRAVFPTRTPYPQETLRVYYFPGPERIKARVNSEPSRTLPPAPP